jgi:hypothetical protein
VSCKRGCCQTQAEHYKSVRLGVTSIRAIKDRQESADMDAYARLRRDGVQPKSITGSAELERFASTTHEIENRNIITDPQVRRRVTSAFETAPPPSTTPIGPPDAA